MVSRHTICHMYGVEILPSAEYSRVDSTLINSTVLHDTTQLLLALLTLLTWFGAKAMQVISAMQVQPVFVCTP